MIYAYRLNLIRIGVLCRPYSAKKHQYIAILTKFSHFAGLLCPPATPLYRSGPNLARDPRSTRRRQISFEYVYCVTFQGQKTANLGKFYHLGWLGYPAHFTSESKIWYAIEQTRSLHLVAKFRLHRFLDFGILWCRQLAAI